jgi:allene oxide cyclase
VRVTAEQWGQKSRVGLAVFVFALAGWCLADHPGIAGAAKKPAAAKHGAIKHAKTVVHVIEHAVTDTVIQSGGSGDVTGNLLTFHNKVYNPADTKQVGTDQGYCVRIAPAEGSWECSWTTFLAQGQLTVQGPYYDTKNSVLSVTGGTRAFRRARGEMKLLSRNGGKEYDFIFRLS